MFDQISSMANRASTRDDDDDDGEDRCHLNWLCNANINTAKHETCAHTHTHSCWCCFSWCLWCCCHKHIKVYGYWKRSTDNNSNNNIGGNNGNDLDQSHLMQICDLTGITGVRREIFRAAEHGRKTCRRCFLYSAGNSSVCVCVFLLLFVSLPPSIATSKRVYALQLALQIAVDRHECWWRLMA